MEPWAQRINHLLLESGQSQAALARACGIGEGSVSGWFGKGKPTKMISGDNLVSAARFLNTTADYIMTGKTFSGSAPASQPVGLDPSRLASALALVEGAIADSRKRIPHAMKATMLARVYAMPELTDESEPAVRAALAGILESLGDGL